MFISNDFKPSLYKIRIVYKSLFIEVYILVYPCLHEKSNKYNGNLMNYPSPTGREIYSMYHYMEQRILVHDIYMIPNYCVSYSMFYDLFSNVIRSENLFV